MKQRCFPFPLPALLARLALVGLLAGSASSARAEEPDEPLPGERVADGVFTVGVMGDSLADGVWAAIYRMLQRDPRFDIVNLSRQSSGLARPEYFDWPAAAATFSTDLPLDAVVIAVGLNDNQAMDLDDDKRLGYREDGWDAEYRERVDSFLAPLEEAGLSATWVGLPTMRSSARAEHATLLNGLFSSATEEKDVPYVDTWALTADENGEYATHLPDENGRKRLMRANDGIHFTSKGYDLLARAVLASMATRLPVFQMDGTQ